MKKRYSFLIIFLLFTFVTSHAQVEYQLNDAVEFYRQQKIASGELRNVLTEKDIDGSPYMNDEFIKGAIYTTSKTKYSDIPLRYNIYNDEIEFQTPDNSVAALGSPEIVEKVTFGDYTMEYIPFDLARKVKRGFFKVVLKGNASLYARPEIQFVQAKEPAPYQDAVPAKFLQKGDRYYIRIGLEAAAVTGNKKDVLALFPNHSDQLEAFIKKDKINVKKEDDLKKLVEYYNSF